MMTEVSFLGELSL